MSLSELAARTNVHTFVVDSLGSRIAAGELPAATVLTLAGLEAEYGVSRTVIREAVRVLESHGLLVSRRRVGVTVQPIAAWDVLDASVIHWRLAGSDREQQLVELMELRSAVEPVAARLAAARAGADQRAGLVHLADRLAALGREGRGNSPDFLVADNAFHTLLLQASGNPLLTRLAGPVTEVLAGRIAHQMLGGVPEPGTLEGHLAVAAGVAAGDGTAAQQASATLTQIITGEIRPDETGQV
ncbi:MAG: FCD domain-containing protein [Propionibacteriaceae bacterium]|jgi:DNA-binding FadR family transcriptional regulator|nr:FCD domain-containing protein [Propionibacteriaceae bacterium]